MDRETSWKGSTISWSYSATLAFAEVLRGMNKFKEAPCVCVSVSVCLCVHRNGTLDRGLNIQDGCVRLLTEHKALQRFFISKFKFLFFHKKLTLQK
jgi:hypothetical protein